MEDGGGRWAMEDEVLFDMNACDEVVLVRLALSALHGNRPAIEDIEKLSSVFCTAPAHISSNHISSVWQRSSSKNALGKILKSIHYYGCICLCLHEFVNFFIHGAIKQTEVQLETQHLHHKEQATDHVNIQSAAQSVHQSAASPPYTYSIVNHAFAVAVNAVVHGYHSALNTLQASITLRRLSNDEGIHKENPKLFSETGNVNFEPNGTLLEIYIHTEELRSHIGALGTICMLDLDSTYFNPSVKCCTTTNSEFHRFPTGSSLLSYLYVLLQDAEPVRDVLLKFLFYHSWEPFCRHIRSWIYKATLDDPYKEFLVEYVNDISGGNDTTFHYSSSWPPFRVRKSAVPCFLENMSCLIVRAGQQLQVLMKLLEHCSFMITCANARSKDPQSFSQITKLEDVLPFYDCSEKILSSPLIFSKEEMEALVGRRKNMFLVMKEKSQKFFEALGNKLQKYEDRALLPEHVRACDMKLVGVASSMIHNNVFIEPRPAISIPKVDDFMEDAHAFGACGEVGSSDLDYSDHGSDDFDGSLNQDFEKEQLQDRHDFTSLLKLKVVESSHVQPHFMEEILLKDDFQIERPNALEGLVSSSDCHVLDEPALKTECSELDQLEPMFSSQSCQSCLFPSCTNDLPAESWFYSALPKFPAIVDDCLLFGGENCLQNNGGKFINTTVQHEPETHSLSYYFLKMNPLLIRHNLALVPRNQYLSNWVSCLAFSSIESLFDVVVERSLHIDDRSVLDKTSQKELSTFSKAKYAIPSSLTCDGTTCKSNFTFVTEASVVLSHDDATVEEKACPQRIHSQENVSGGAEWQNILSSLCKTSGYQARSHDHYLVTDSEMPLEYIIENCIIQEILLQYKYISSFSVRLLFEGFGLQEDLLALRQYHFMGASGWASTFILSLCQNISSILESRNKLSMIQEFLDKSFHTSLCEEARHRDNEEDRHRDKLHVSIKEPSLMPFPCSSGIQFGIHTLDFICLEYRVAWPVSIVLSPHIVNKYSLIFNFLAQIKMAMFFLNHIWCSLKNLKRISGYEPGNVSKSRDISYLLFPLRQKLNHFIVALQQYLQTELLHGAWWRFHQNIQYEVKDIFDLEPVHGKYLSEALQICFKSPEMETAANIIDNILQCILDFCSCFPGGPNCFLTSNSSPELSPVNISRVLEVNMTFQKNMRELYALSLQSERHSEFGLWRLWDQLDYNQYFSNMFSS